MDFNINKLTSMNSLSMMDVTALNSFYVSESTPTPQNAAYWQPDSSLNNALRKQAGIRSNWDYRRYMTNQAVGIMNYNTEQAQQAFGLPVYFTSDDCIKKTTGYDSDLKQSYVSREKMMAKMVSPSL
jgi:hypothetical protein